jgi:hypothetical protein
MISIKYQVLAYLSMDKVVVRTEAYGPKYGLTRKTDLFGRKKNGTWSQICHAKWYQTLQGATC